MICEMEFQIAVMRDGLMTNHPPPSKLLQRQMSSVCGAEADLLLINANTPQSTPRSSFS